MVRYWRYGKWLVPVALLVVGLLLGHRLRSQPRLQVLRSPTKGPPTLMLLHGYGSTAEQWLPYTHTVSLPPTGRFLFPQGPENVVRYDGLMPAHAWWNLDLAAHRRDGKLGVDLRQIGTRGLARAAFLVERALEDEGNSAQHLFILGGFF